MTQSKIFSRLSKKGTKTLAYHFRRPGDSGPGPSLCSEMTIWTGKSPVIRMTSSTSGLTYRCWQWTRCKDSREQGAFSHTDWEDWVGHQGSAAERCHLLLLHDLEATCLSQAWSDCRTCGRGWQWRSSQWWRCRRWLRVMPRSSSAAWPCLQCRCVIVLQRRGQCV